MIIGIDIDEILADWVSRVAESHNQKYGTSLKKADFHSYKFWEVWGGTREEAIEKIYSFMEEHIEKVSPVTGSIEAIRTLKNGGHELHVITGRRNEFINQTKRWLDQHFPEIFTGVYFTNHYTNNGVSLRKIDICKEMGIEVLIEDDVVHALDVAQDGVQVLLMDYPWNQGISHTNLKRVFSWEEILEIIKVWPAK